MEFSVLNEETIQCVLSEEEMADYGMNKQALFQNDERVNDFFKSVMRQAEKETGFMKKRGDVTVHAAFLSDESLEITFYIQQRDRNAVEGAHLDVSKMPRAVRKYSARSEKEKQNETEWRERIAGSRGKTGYEGKTGSVGEIVSEGKTGSGGETGSGEKTGSVGETASGEEIVEAEEIAGNEKTAALKEQSTSSGVTMSEEIPEIATAVLKSKNLMTMIAFCETACGEQLDMELKTWLYKYNGVYFMLADIQDRDLRKTAILFNLADEYMDGVCHTEVIAAFLREHGTSMIADCAMGVLGRLGH